MKNKGKAIVFVFVTVFVLLMSTPEFCELNLYFIPFDYLPIEK